MSAAEAGGVFRRARGRTLDAFPAGTRGGEDFGLRNLPPGEPSVWARAPPAGPPSGPQSVSGTKIRSAQPARKGFLGRHGDASGRARRPVLELFPWPPPNFPESRVRRQSSSQERGLALRLGLVFHALSRTRCSASFGLSSPICKTGTVTEKFRVALDKRLMHVRCRFFYWGRSPRCVSYAAITVIYYNMSHPPKCSPCPAERQGSQGSWQN